MADELKIGSQEEREAAAAKACKDNAYLEEILEWFECSSRIKRQKAASTIAMISNMDATVLLPYADAIQEGVNRPEAQTRWETLHALDQMGKAGQRYGSDVIAAAEDALYDEKSGIVREAAFHFFCGYGGASEKNSVEVWPLIDEAIQCYHGDTEFADMLTYLVEFAQGSIAMETSAALAMRMKFDSENGSGTLRMRSEQIVNAYLERGGELSSASNGKASEEPQEELDEFDEE